MKENPALAPDSSLTIQFSRVIRFPDLVWQPNHYDPLSLCLQPSSTVEAGRTPRCFPWPVRGLQLCPLQPSTVTSLSLRTWKKMQLVPTLPASFLLCVEMIYPKSSYLAMRKSEWTSKSVLSVQRCSQKS